MVETSPWVAVMVVVASVVVRRRAARRTSARIPWFEAVTVAVVVLSAAISLVVTFGFGVLPYEPASFALCVVALAATVVGQAVDGRGAVSGWVRPGPHDTAATLR